MNLYVIEIIYKFIDMICLYVMIEFTKIVQII
jgi:hypothetical protein